MQFGKIHTLRLDGIQYINPRLDEITDQRCYESTRVILDQDIGLDLTSSGNNFRQTGLEKLTVKVLTHHQGRLHADIVAKAKYIDAA